MMDLRETSQALVDALLPVRNREIRLTFLPIPLIPKQKAKMLI